MDKIWIPDPVSVCPVHDRVSCAVAISDAADAPQAVATGYDLGQISGWNCRRVCYELSGIYSARDCAARELAPTSFTVTFTPCLDDVTVPSGNLVFNVSS